jgi:spore coat polysaccharide biosynthesis protein SpsF
MRVICFIEARMRSSRLPGKVLLPILGRPILELMIERLRRARLIDDIVIATSDDPSCDAITELADRIGTRYFRGSEDDVLARVLGAARAFNADVIVETTGDCPLHDGPLIDKVVADFKLGGADFVSNILPYTTPRGTDVRVFKTEGLAEIERTSKDPADHEHVSLHYIEHPEKYRRRNVVSELGDDASEFRITVDTREDFELVTRVYESLYPANPDFSLHDVLELLRNRPDLVRLNQQIQQKSVR